ncbi:hypothetical protein N9T87_00135 [bacterium]|nr:hypothetical protein [bacterium]
MKITKRYKPPRRTPSIIPIKIKYLLYNRVVCELGCAEGENLLQMSKYSKHAFGFDVNPNFVKVAKNKSLNVRYLDYRVSNIPIADIYYFWPSNSRRDIPYLVWKILSNSNFKGIIVFGSTNYNSDKIISYIYSIFGERYCYEFFEGENINEHGNFCINIISKSNIHFYFPILLILTASLRLFSFIRMKFNMPN